uniref:Cation_ATPase_C domain-containing protein n=1 Tax=Caenorhabditis tropicalis TaxID=1561998 RepID=A0A1I7V4H0_9PELO
MSEDGPDLGLYSHVAFDRLIHEAKSSIAEWYSIHVVKENRITYSSVAVYALLLLYTILLEVWQNRIRSTAFQQKYRKAFEEILELEKSKPTEFTYSTKSLEAVTGDVAVCQSCFRDGIIVEVPRILLVIGDVIVFRPGQVAPCNCETFDGRVLSEGDRLKWDIKTDKKSGFVQPLEPVYARVTCYPIKNHLEVALSGEDNPLQFDYQLQYMIHKVFEHYVIPLALFASIIATIIRFCYSDDETLFGTRFVFAVPSLTVLPLLILQLPLLLHFVKFMNNREVSKYLNLPPDFETCKDLVSILSSITGTSFIDKKGILSCIHPSIEKVVFATNEADESGNIGIHLEVINLSSDRESSINSKGFASNKWNLSMDDPNWQRYLSNLLPLSYNLLLNSCQQSEHFHQFLDHLAVVSTKVPRTIATANRRCMCQLPYLLGFTPKSLENFQGSPKILGFYKKQPGEAPLPGLTKHRTPIEMAFCTIRDDAKSLHSHLSCQGTANLVVDACTHIWNGNEVIPMSKRIKASVKDFYLRHSMTGHCLAVSYRPCFSKLDESLNGKFVEVPLNHEQSKIETALPRCHSSESFDETDYTESVRTASSAIDQYFTGQILCGLVVLHYEPIPESVSAIEKLDQICVRPVYFSKENELRSRVFAEKLGIEAGWNCHISLAEEDTVPTRKTDVAHEQFVKQKPSRPKFWKRIALSESNLERLDCESLIRGSPSLRKMSMISAKMAPIPNMALLPTGIQNVRPHLEEVDNVPLLVGLFTDSTTSAVEQMVEIMQENGEVVMVIGSCRNPSNTTLYSKANVSICVDDVEESSCRVHEDISESNITQISSRLISLAADFRLDHSKLLKLSSLIVCARHRMSSFRHSLLFILYASLLHSVILLTSTFFFLPIIFTHSQTILTSFLHIPILFLGTLFTNFEPKSKIIRIAPKNSSEIQKPKTKSDQPIHLSIRSISHLCQPTFPIPSDDKFQFNVLIL